MMQRSLATLLSTAIVRAIVQSGSTVSILLVNAFFGGAAVAVYSACLAGIWLAVIIFDNGKSVLLLRACVAQPDQNPGTLYRRCKHSMYQTFVQYVKIGVLLALLGLYLVVTIGQQALTLFILMSPLVFILPLLSLKGMFHKARAEPIRASLLELGVIHILFALLIATGILMGANDLRLVFVPVFAGSLLAAIWLLFIDARNRSVHEGLRDTAAQGKILMNSLLTFVFRNGYPLIFAAIMLPADLGQFRIEERLLFMIVFFYSLYETIAMKRMIAVYGAADPKDAMRYYLRLSATLFTVGCLGSASLFTVLATDRFSGLIGYHWSGDLTFLMAVATPFYFLSLFNNMSLNLLGKYIGIAWAMVCGATAFILGAWLLYPLFQIDGVRLAYLAGGLVTAGVSAGFVIRTLAGNIERVRQI